MTTQMTATGAPPRRFWRSVLAVGAGFVAVVVLSLVTDEILHIVHFYPPWNEPMFDPTQNAVALAYRTVYAVLDSYIAARLAPHAPMGHAILLGVVGLLMGTAGVIATLPLKLGPAWYPIALAVEAVPCGWLGGFLYQRLLPGAEQ